MEGEYGKHYNTLHSLGKGAFGFVRIAQKKDDGLLVSEGAREGRREGRKEGERGGGR